MNPCGDVIIKTLKPRFCSALISVLCILQALSGHAQDQAVDREIAQFSDTIADQVRKSGMKKITILDLTDLSGGTPMLGAFIAEETTVNLVTSNKFFSVLDRAHLNKILAEHKLSQTGLIQPDNAKKLGQLSGVDAIVLGTMTPLKDSIRITAKIISTETGEIVGAAKGMVTKTSEIEKMLSTNGSPITGISTDITQTNSIQAPPVPERPTKSIRSFGDIEIEFESLQVTSNGQFLLHLNLANRNKSKPLWLALQRYNNGQLKGKLTDESGTEFDSQAGMVFGIPVSQQFGQGFGFNSSEFNRTVDLKPGESISVSVRFYYPYSSHPATPGNCRLEMELASGDSYNEAIKPHLHNISIGLVAK